MPTLIITLDGRELQRVPLTRPRTTVGRRPYNDIVMEHLAVSGEHAVFVLQPDGRVQVLDLNSTNGTYVNGRTIVSAD
ncbi:MAG: FHA domain-containing protein, partial [Tepidimonas taiwanensis]|nr:FHA domain-containing protein [Tepidimonas taiwanensis]